MEEKERSELKKLHKEQERERRRLRDRQRRQSMSVEEREKHLARRRRNYQLRRLRAENAAKLDLDQPQPEQMTTSNQLGAPPSVSSDVNVGSHQECNVNIGSHQGCTKTKSEGLEVPAHKLAKFSGQLRLNRLKHLARSLNDPVDENHTVEVDVTIKGNEASGISSKGLRLNRVKHFARLLNSSVRESNSQNYPNQVQE